MNFKGYVIDKIKARVWGGGQDDIQEIISEYPSTEEFYELVAKELECEITDIICLTTDCNEEDEEGWKIETFFPNYDIEAETLFDEYQVDGFFFIRSS